MPDTQCCIAHVSSDVMKQLVADPCTANLTYCIAGSIFLLFFADQVETAKFIPYQALYVCAHMTLSFQVTSRKWESLVCEET